MQSARPVIENPLASQQTSIINTKEGRGYIKSNTYWMNVPSIEVEKKQRIDIKRKHNKLLKFLPPRELTSGISWSLES